MDARRILLLVFALVGVGLIFFLVRSVLQDDVQEEASTEMVKVLVASRPLPIGTILAQGDLRWQDWPEEALAVEFITEVPREVAGAGDGNRPVRTRPIKISEYVNTYAIRAEVGSGKPVHHADMVKVGSKGFVAAALRPGMRAVTVRLTGTANLAGLVYPGDRVDLLLTHNVDIANRGSFSVTETIIQNLRVLALDTRLNGQSRGAPPGAPRTATFEVPPRMAEKLVVAGTRGALSLALRSLATEDPDAPGDEPFDGIVTRTWSEELSPTMPRKTVLPDPGGSVQRSGVTVHRGQNTSVEVMGTVVGGSGSDGELPRVRDELLEGQVLIKSNESDDEEGQ